jgi:hypothetical protein
MGFAVALRRWTCCVGCVAEPRGSSFHVRQELHFVDRGCLATYEDARNKSRRAAVSSDAGEGEGVATSAGGLVDLQEEAVRLLKQRRSFCTSQNNVLHVAVMHDQPQILEELVSRHRDALRSPSSGTVPRLTHLCNAFGRTYLTDAAAQVHACHHETRGPAVLYCAAAEVCGRRWVAGIGACLPYGDGADWA